MADNWNTSDPFWVMVIVLLPMALATIAVGWAILKILDLLRLLWA